MAKKLFLDADNTIFNTTKAFIDTYLFIYGRKYMYATDEAPRWDLVKRYDFSDQLHGLTKGQKEIVFDTKTLNDKLTYYDDAKHIINKLSQQTDVVIVSMCSYKTAHLKGEKIAKDMPNVKFQPIIYPHFKDKSHIDMRGGVFVDDVAKNLHTSSADERICFRYNNIVMDVNEDWKGKVLSNWNEDTYNYLKDLLQIK